MTRGSSRKTEAVMAGSEVKLIPGDGVSYDQGVVHEVRNTGVTPAVTLESRLNPITPAS